MWFVLGSKNPVELLPKTNEEFEEDYGSYTENIATLYKKFEKERLRKLRLCRQERERIIEENQFGYSEDESIGDETPVEDESYRIMDTPHEGDDSLKHKTTERPSILDYLDASSTHQDSVNNNNLNNGEEIETMCHNEEEDEEEEDSGYTCTTPDTPDSLVISPLEEEEAGARVAAKKKKTDVQRSQSMKVKIDVLPEPVITAAINLIDGDDVNLIESFAASPSSTYSLQSEIDHCGDEEPIATSEKKKKCSEVKRSQSLKMKRDSVRNKAAATWKDGRRGVGSPFFRTSGALLSSSSRAKGDEGTRSNTAEPPRSTPYAILSDSSPFYVEDSNEDKKKQTKVKRSQSFKLKGEQAQQEFENLCMTLPKEVRENPTLISKEDKKLLDQYLLRINTDQKLETEKDCTQCSKPCGTKEGSKRIQKTSSCSVADKKNKEGHLNHSNTSKENTESEGSKWKTKYKKQVQKMDQRLNSIERERYFGQEIDSNISSNRAPRKPQRSPSIRRGPFIHEEQKNEKQMRAEHNAQLSDLKEKHKRAGQEFQDRMKLKLQQREFNKIKQLERKEFQERQLQAMENDLKMWQEELKNYQNICSERATRIVEKKNAITSMKTHEKRLQKEMEHAMMKSRVDEEERQRQEELKMLVNIKDARSRMIINAKAEYANAGRDCAQLSRSIRSRLHEKEITSSFDKMASKGERMARLERMNSVKRDVPPKLRTQRKNQSMVHLG